MLRVASQSSIAGTRCLLRNRVRGGGKGTTRVYNAAGQPCAATRTGTLVPWWSVAHDNTRRAVQWIRQGGVTAVTDETVRAFGVGAVAGVVTSLAGLGGALVMIPLLTAAPFSLSQHAAHGTTLCAVAVTCVTGAVTYRDHFDVDQCAVPAVVVALSGMVTARWGARATNRLSSIALKRALGSLMLGLSVAVPCKDYIMMYWPRGSQKGLETTEAPHPVAQQFWQRILPHAAVGGASGYLAGLFGIGGGTLVVPALTILCSSANDDDDDESAVWSHYQILATSLAATALPAMVGTASHVRAGNVVWRLAPVLAAGASFGAVIGGRLGQETNQGTLRTGLTALLAVLGTRTLIRV